MRPCIRFLLCFMLFSISFTAFAQPANDNCVDAIAIGEVTMEPFTTEMATTDGLDHADDCMSGGTFPEVTVNDVWYLYTAGFTGLAEWSLCGMANFDTKIFVYNGTAMCSPTDADIIACSEDGPNCDQATSLATFDVITGETYLLRLGGWGGDDDNPAAEGIGTFTVGEYVEPDGPANNNCENAIEIFAGTEQPVDNTGATTDGPDHPDNPCFGFGDITVSADVWYVYNATFDGFLEWSTCNSVSYDSRLAVYTGGTPCAYVDEDLLACNDDGAGCDNYTSTLYFAVESGVTYYLRLGGWNGAQGVGTMDLTEIIPPDPPLNDLCDATEEVSVISFEQAENFEVAYAGTTISAGFDPVTFEFPSCITNTNGGEFADVWYTFNTEDLTRVEVRLNATPGETTPQFYFDLWDACDSNSISMVTNNCLNASLDDPFVIDTISGLAPNTDYLVRVITRLTSDFPGEFWFQLVRLQADEPIIENVTELGLSAMEFYPNPTSNEATLQFDLTSTAQTRIEISNILGQVVYRDDKGTLISGAHNFNLDLSDLKSGVYLLTTHINGSSKTIKFVKE